MNENTVIAIIAVCITAIVIAHIWASAKRKYPR
ncbi:hypothetical protein QFZ67_005000 [Streptomyces sp. V1I1]|nr:hypothetical protein [Streptomyces sp. V1I1]